MGTSTESRSGADWELLRACAAARCDAARIRALVQRAPSGPELLTLAREHGVLPLLAKALETAGALEELPTELRQSLRESRRAHLVFTLSLTAELFRLAGRLEAEGIESVAVKGPVLAAQAFGDAGLRQYSDLDLLVRHCDILRAARVMKECGFTAPHALAAAAGKIPGQFLFLRERPRAIVELHTESTLRYFPRRFPVDAFFARRSSVVLGGRSVPALSPEDTLVFICVHGSKHYWGRLLWIADVAGILARPAALDWPWVFAAARETGTERMLHLGLRLARDVLRAELPPAVAAAVLADRSAARLAARACAQLPSAQEAAGGAFRRARTRMQMCGGALRSVGYLLRLAFTPTEEDWGGPQQGKTGGRLSALLRPLRLARKYRTARGAPAGGDAAQQAEASPERKKARA